MNLAMENPPWITVHLSFADDEQALYQTCKQTVPQTFSAG